MVLQCTILLFSKFRGQTALTVNKVLVSPQHIPFSCHLSNSISIKFSFIIDDVIDEVFRFWPKSKMKLSNIKSITILAFYCSCFIVSLQAELVLFSFIYFFYTYVICSQTSFSIYFFHFQFFSLFPIFCVFLDNFSISPSKSNNSLSIDKLSHIISSTSKLSFAEFSNSLSQIRSISLSSSDYYSLSESKFHSKNIAFACKPFNF